MNSNKTKTELREEKRKKLNLYNNAEFAKLSEVDVITVERWKANGILILKNVNGKDYINTEKSYLELYKYYYKKANGKEDKKDVDTLKKELLKASINHKNMTVELQRLRKDIQEGKYLLAEKVEEENAKFLTIIRNFVMSIPSQLMGMVASKLDKATLRETQANIEEQAKNLLRNFGERIKSNQIDNGKIMLNEKGEKRKKRGRRKKN